MAGLYVATKEVQPEGPYLLAGWSFGGWWPTKCAAAARGMTAPLAMLDTYAPAALSDDLKT